MKFIRLISKIFFVMFIVVVGWRCAAVQAPPGGPVDTVPPELLIVDPPGMTVNFNQKTTWLTFSEHLDENSVKNALNVYPALNPGIKQKYKDKRIRVTWPDNLMMDRTYILNISRSLKDEHGVHLKEPIQIAYGTGKKIDNGRISGHVYGGKNPALFLWQTDPDSLNDSLVYHFPDFEVQASDEGNYSFGFLPEGTFRLVAFDGPGPGRSIPQEQLHFGIPFQERYYTSDSTALENIDIIIPEKIQNLRIQRLIPGGVNWGKIIFNRNLSGEEALGILFPVDSLNSQNIKTFIFGADSTVLVFMFEPETWKNADSLKVQNKKNTLSAQFTIRGKFKSDTLKPTLLPYKKNFIYNLVPDFISPLNIYADRPIADSAWSKYDIKLFKDDTVLIPSKSSLENPMWIKILPDENLSPESKYQILVVDSLTVGRPGNAKFPFKTSAMAGIGNLEGEVGVGGRENLVVQIKEVENPKNVYRNFVNSSSYYSIENVYEGKYTLMLFEDGDRNFRYSNGSLIPFRPGEWFYMYPDTIDIRGNWTIQVNIK